MTAVTDPMALALRRSAGERNVRPHRSLTAPASIQARQALVDMVRQWVRVSGDGMTAQQAEDVQQLVDTAFRKGFETGRKAK